MEVLQRTANRGSISTGGYEVDNSVKLEVDNNEWLYRNSPTAGNRKTFTLSLWLKRAVLGHVPAGADEYLAGQGSSARYHFAGDTIRFMFAGNSTELESSRVYRDPSAWYHFVLAVDTTQGTAANRVKLYINGVQEAWSNTEYPDQNAESDWMNTNDLYIGTKWASNTSGEGDNDLSGYLSEVVLLDGTAASPTSFGEFDSDSGIWIPIDVSGLTFGSEGFYLNFATAGDLGDDKSGNGNDLTESNLAAADQATDTPTNNFCTLNPIVNFKYTTNGITEGGTTFGDNTGGGVGGAFGTMAVTSGKWYWEAKLVQQNAHYLGVSAVDDGDNVLSTSDPHQVNSTFNFNISAARIEYINGGSVTAGSLDAFTDFHTAGDIISIALNMDDNQISIYGNGTLQAGVANTSLFDAANKMVVPFHGTVNDTVQYNFGGYSAWTPSSAATDGNGYGTFEYAPPTGYYALCTKNLAEYG